MCVRKKGGYEIEKTGVFWLGDVVLVYTYYIQAVDSGFPGTNGVVVT